MTKSNQPREPEVTHRLLCFLFSGPNRRIWCGKKQPAVSLHQKWVQPWQSHNHRGGVQHQNGGARRPHNQGPDLGHGRAGAIPGHYICVRVKTITFRGAISVCMCGHSCIDANSLIGMWSRQSCINFLCLNINLYFFYILLLLLFLSVKLVHGQVLGCYIIVWLIQATSRYVNYCATEYW